MNVYIVHMYMCVCIHFCVQHECISQCMYACAYLLIYTQGTPHTTYIHDTFIPSYTYGGCTVYYIMTCGTCVPLVHAHIKVTLFSVCLSTTTICTYLQSPLHDNLF